MSNPNDPRTPKQCINCGTPITKRAKRCYSCNSKKRMAKVDLSKENNPNWRGGKTIAYCIDCGKRISKYHKRCKSCAKKGSLSVNWKGGIKKSICECGKSISKNAIQCPECWYKTNQGENNPAWNGGVTPLRKAIRELPKYHEWRMNVYRRDNFKCNQCGKKKKRLHAHHINEFADIMVEFLEACDEDMQKIVASMAINFDLFWDIDNGITLCEVCHANQHLIRKKQ